jgi:hypothetical protein
MEKHLRVDRRAFVIGSLCVMFLASTGIVAGQEVDSPAASTTSTLDAASLEQTQIANPWSQRPVCASMFLKSDWQLTSKQRACDWIQNRLLSTNAMLGAAWSAGVSKFRDAESEEGDGFGTRFARRFAQSAFKSTGTYIGSVIAREDPRLAPPYLAMSAKPRPRGFFKRTGHALAANFVSYRCLADCSKPEHIDRQPALSRALGALASGYAAEVWTWDRETSHNRALRGAATAYGTTFINALFVEFKPELSAFAGRTFGALFGFK